VVAALRKCGIPLETILSSQVHGRGGLQARYLQHKENYHSETADANLAAMPGAADPSKASWDVDAVLAESQAQEAQRAAAANVTSFRIDVDAGGDDDTGASTDNK
jgi:hypothetical protein